MLIAVVVVNWNDTASSLRALESIKVRPDVLRVLLDNHSDDDPTAEVSRALPDVVVERLPTNAGYAAACNDGVRVGVEHGATHVLVMNNDAELDADALDALAAADADHPSSILAPVIVFAEDPGEVWSAGGYLEPPCVRNHHLGLGEKLDRQGAARRVEWATGCALWFSIDTFRRVGPLDEAFFLYLEDVDWCLRARRAGVDTWVIPAAVVRHEVSRTTGELPTETIRYYAYRNHFRLAFRHARGAGRVAVTGELVWTLAKIGMRTVASSDFRHDQWYHARTRAVRDFMIGRWGPMPIEAAARPTVSAPS